VLDHPRLHDSRTLLRQPQVVDLLPFRIRLVCDRHPLVEIEQDIARQLDADLAFRLPDRQRLYRPFGALYWQYKVYGRKHQLKGRLVRQGLRSLRAP
jgi:hypothetical protein